MDMKKIKIISNPYKKKITYQEWDEHTASWENIIAETHPHSKLISKEFENGFFPFKIEKILNQIKKEYYSDEIDSLEIIFEGTRDEFYELKALSQYEGYREYLCASNDDQILENARDILPQIRMIFKEKIFPLVNESISNRQMIQEDLEKFTDASNEIIPICVLGNYSAGKSTFINALIGREILPSAERPTTAKIFKIAQEKEEKATVRFTYKEEKISVVLKEDTHSIEPSEENELVKSIESAMNRSSDISIYAKLKNILEIINEYEREKEDGSIDDLIEITVPFSKGIWKQTENKFVIFDTPGSNSASNRNHFEVLKKAMTGLTNGIPIFVTKYDQLDTTDNEKLYNAISSMKELDNRFTMIVVNKADTSSLPRDGFSDIDVREIFRQKVPKMMYASGIYFVSSVIGMGYKNNGQFFDEHSAEIYEDNKEKYEDKESKYYKTLYKYNIMPEQMKKNAMEEAEKSEEVILANSGLYTIEQEILSFANKYAAYNKCEQSKLFLENMIEITSTDIEEVKKERQKQKSVLEEKLETEKKILLDKIHEKGKEQKELYIQEYPDKLEAIAEQSVFTYTDEKLKERENELISQYQEKFDYVKEGQDIKDAAEALTSGLKENVSEFLNQKFTVNSLKKIGKDLMHGVKEMTGEIEEWNAVRLSAEIEAGDYLIKEIEKDFDLRLKEGKNTIENGSKLFWEEVTKAIRQELLHLIADSDELTEDKRQELSEIIINYKDIEFDTDSDEIFAKQHFEKRFVLFGETGKLNLMKLRRTYNFSMKEDIDQLYSMIRVDHEAGFKEWIEELLNIIEENIIEYSPALHEQSIKIEKETERIRNLEFRYSMLQNYRNEIKSMMDWKLQ